MGLWSLGFSLALEGIRLRVDKLREGLGCRFVRVDGLCSALGLEPAFRRVWGWV